MVCVSIDSFFMAFFRITYLVCAHFIAVGLGFYIFFFYFYTLSEVYEVWLNHTVNYSVDMNWSSLFYDFLQ